MNIPAQLETSLQGEDAIIDRAVVLDRVGGDEELLREITFIFLDEYPALIDGIQAAVRNQDAKGLERAAHTLKGSVANFGAQAATQAAYRLESMGRRGDLEAAGSAVEDLIARFAELHPLLEELASE